MAAEAPPVAVDAPATAHAQHAAAPAPHRPLIRLPSGWRTTVAAQARRLSDELALVPAEHRGDPAYERVEDALRRAGALASTPDTLLSWWTGSGAEAAWAALQSAREGLVMLQDDATLRAQLPTLRRLAARSPDGETLVAQIDSWMDSAHPPDRATVRQLWQEAHLAVEADHAAIRQFRNFLLEATVLMAVALLIAVIVDGSHRDVIGIGAVAGAVTTVIPLTTAGRPNGPYALATAQALLRIPAGGAAALLGVLVLREGFASLQPAVGDAAVFYAVTFGLAQHILTRMVDRRAEALLAGAQPEPEALPDAFTFFRRSRASGVPPAA